jgi:general secretion pathway protein B
MSYILDALRKSDQQRQRGAAPMTLTAAAPVVAPRQPAISSNVLLAVVLVGAGIVIGWLRPWQPAVPAPEPSAAKPLASSPRLALPEPLPGVPEKAEKPEPPLHNSTSAGQSPSPSGSSTINQAAPALARTETSPQPPQAVTGEPKKAATPLPDKPMVTDLADAGRTQGVRALSELPAAIQQEIPRLSVSLHVYAKEPKDCLVMINDKLLRQGELLVPGLRLEQVTPDGVIISYKGYRFHRGVR